jgi:hypothetical protein
LTNLGSTFDEFTISISSDLTQNQYKLSNTGNVGLAQGAVFEGQCTITIDNGTSTGEYSVTIRASSLGAELSGGNVSDTVTFTVLVIEKEDSGAGGGSETTDQGDVGSSAIVVFAILMVLIAIGIAFLLLMKRKKKETEPLETEEPEDTVEESEQQNIPQPSVTGATPQVAPVVVTPVAIQGASSVGPPPLAGVQPTTMVVASLPQAVIPASEVQPRTSTAPSPLATLPSPPSPPPGPYS